MSKKVFVSYGNAPYYKSLERIGKEAKELHIFDEIILYKDTDLPTHLLNHELLKHKRGGGYWFWKPFVVQQVLQKLNEDDILFYCDAGCILFPHKEWSEYFKILKRKDAIFFTYGAKMGQWCRKNLLDHFCNLQTLKSCFQVQGTLMFLRKPAQPIINRWYDLMHNHPEFVIDVTKEELNTESKNFKEHRHDQAILTCVAYEWYKSQKNIDFQWQHCESRKKSGQAIFAARISDDNVRNNPDRFESPFVTLLKKYIYTPYRVFKNKYYLSKL